MKRLAVLALALLLGACSLGLTDSFTNPVGPVDIYRVKNVYGAAVQAEIDYRAFCYSTTFRVVMADPIRRPICQYRRRVITKFQKTRPTVRIAINKAEDFIIANPNLSAASLIAPAWEAVNALKSLIPVVPK